MVHHTVRGMYGAPEAGARTVYVPWRSSRPVPQVRSLRRRAVRAACTVQNGASGGRTCQHGARPQPRAPSSCCYRLARADGKLAARGRKHRTGPNVLCISVSSSPSKFVPRARSTRETRGRPQGRLPARERNVHAEEPPHERAEGVQGGRVRGGPRLLQAYAAAGSNPGRAYPRRPSVGAGGAPSASSASASLAQACSSHRCSSLLTGALRTEDGEQSALVHLTFAVSGAAHYVVSQPAALRSVTARGTT